MSKVRKFFPSILHIYFYVDLKLLILRNLHLSRGEHIHIQNYSIIIKQQMPYKNVNVLVKIKKKLVKACMLDLQPSELKKITLVF